MSISRSVKVGNTWTFTFTPSTYVLVSRRRLVAETAVQSEVTICQICGRIRGTTAAPPPPTLPHSIIPLMFHIHSSSCNRRYTISRVDGEIK